MKFAWLRMQPLGGPVVPDVYDERRQVVGLDRAHAFVHRLVVDRVSQRAQLVQAHRSGGLALEQHHVLEHRACVAHFGDLLGLGGVVAEHQAAVGVR